MTADRRSPLHARHRTAGATMTSFAGWDMPVHYGSVVAEHRAVREDCGVFDLSHLGTVRISGPHADACAQRVLSNDVSALQVGRAQYTLCLDADGGIVDDLLLYRLPDGLLAVPNAANTAAVTAALSAAARALGSCEVTDLGAVTACVAVQGPRSPAVLHAAGFTVDGLGYLECRQGGDGLVLARSGYTGERGYELFLPAERATDVWDRVVGEGAARAGLGCRDTLRLEMGYPLHGQDLSTATSPVEARLTWAVKGSGFVGEEAYRRAKEAGASRRLWGLRATGRGIPRAGCQVRADGEVVGEVTSGTFSPTLRVGIALGYLTAAPGGEVVIDVRGKQVPAEVVRPPFVESSPKD